MCLAQRHPKLEAPKHFNWKYYARDAVYAETGVYSEDLDDIWSTYCGLGILF